MGWATSLEWDELDAAHEWGLHPRAWRRESKEDRALMVAWCRVTRRMEAVEGQDQRERSRINAALHGGR